MDINEALFEAVGHLNKQLARKLIQLGGDINGCTEAGESVWCSAVNASGVNFALELGADPAILSVVGFNALWYCMFSDDAESVLILLDAGAELCQNIDPDGNNLLHAAASSGSSNTLALLLDKMSPKDLLVRNRFGMTPLEESIKYENKKCEDIIRKRLKV